MAEPSAVDPSLVKRIHLVAIAGVGASRMTGGAAGRAHRPVLLGIAIALVAANLRTPLASVGPVLADLRADLALSATAAALLTALPVFCLGALAAVAPALARRFGAEWAVLATVGAITGGQLLRIAFGEGALFTGSLIASGGIAIANVLLPALIKRDFAAAHTGTMMGVYTMALAGSAAVAAGATVPLGSLLDFGWRGALGIWAAPAAVALAVWLPFCRSGERAAETRPPGRSLLYDPLAWQVTVFFGLQSLSFYAALAWLPSIYRDQGYSAAAAGLLLSSSPIFQIPVALVLPRIAARAADQRLHGAAFTLLVAAGVAGVLLAPTAAPYLWMLFLGAGQGGTFAVGLTLFVLRTRNTADTARLSAMAQTFGYLIAGGGPFLVGAVHDLTHSWTPPLVLLLLLLVPQLVAGVLAGRPLHVGAGPSRRYPRVEEA